MYSFENYTLVVYETPKDFHTELPARRFVALLKEIPEPSLHEYGSTQEEAIGNLAEEFGAYQEECKAKGIALPSPETQQEEFSGRIVLRMPPWLHKDVAQKSAADGISINSFICNDLIKTTTIDKLAEALNRKHADLITRLSYRIQCEQSKLSFSSPKGRKVIPIAESNQYQLKSAIWYDD